jgi:hypothetical protein
MQSTRQERHEKEEQMKTTLAKKTGYLGAGAGLVLFGIFGLLPGCLLGGAAGIKFAGMFFGLPLEPGIISRSLVLLSMLIGVLVSGIVIATAASSAGWLAGAAFESAVTVYGAGHKASATP